MTRILFSILTTLCILTTYAQSPQPNYQQLRQQALRQQPFKAPATGSLKGSHPSVLLPAPEGCTGMNKAPRKVENVDDEFIFNPEGREDRYCMSLYSYDTKNSKFVHAQSLFSLVRTAADGKTVYFRNLTESLGAITWLKGEKRVMEKDSLEVGIHKGDTIIQVPFGQPLVYYQSRYLVFFAPMMYTDSTGNMEAQDNYTLILRADSLLQPTYPEGIFQAAAGYVVISEQKQGTLSLDIDHQMRLENSAIATLPSGTTPTDYVYTFTNSYGNVYKKKAKVLQQGADLYMQLSTSAPNAYVKGTLSSNGRIEIATPQLITDSTFLYYYSLCDPIYEAGQLTDFVPTTATRLQFDESTSTISPLPAVQGQPVFSAEYLDGMEYVKDYVENPTLTLYPGDLPATPRNPEIREVNLDGGMVGSITFNYISFITPALDVDSNYINVDSIYYRLYINNNLYTFTPEVYKNLKQQMTDVPYAFTEGFDFYSYDYLHYIYLYAMKDEVESIGVQTVYKIDGKEYTSDIITEHFTIDPDDPRKANDLAFSTVHLKSNMLQAGEQGSIRGVISNNGKNDVSGYNISLTTDGATTVVPVNQIVRAGNTDAFEVPFTALKATGKAHSIELTLALQDGRTDENILDNTARLTYGIYSESFTQPNLLIEEFTSESCGWCPAGAYRLHTAIQESGLSDKAIWVCHHAGYGVDWLTVDASKDYTALYGGNSFAPAMMINRDQQYSDEPYPVYGIGKEEEIKDTLAQALLTPCFVNIEATNTYADSTLTVQVTVHKSPLFDLQCAEPRLTVFVVEDSIKSKKQKTYDSHTIDYHHNALRSVLTSTWGDSINWTDSNQSDATFSYRVPADQSVQHLRIVAFVHEGATDINQRRIFNVTLSATDPATGIEALEAEDGEWKTANEASPLNACRSTYNLNGQRVSPTYKGVVIKNHKKVIQ